MCGNMNTSFVFIVRESHTLPLFTGMVRSHGIFVDTLLFLKDEIYDYIHSSKNGLMRNDER